MANEMIKFLRGNVANLPQTATVGALYFTKDEGIYLGMEDGSYHRYGDFIIVENVNSLPTTGAHATCMYYCTAENILARYDSVKGWVQINKQPTAEEMKTLLGLGSAAYTDATDYDVAGAAEEVRTYVGDIPNDENGDPMAASVIAYINKKTDGIATSGNLEALGNRVSTAEEEIDALQEASAKHVEKVDGKSLIANSEIDRLAGMSDGANKVEASEINGSIKIDGEEVVVYAHPDKHAIADVTGLQDALDGKQAVGDYATKEEAKGYADDKDEAINKKLDANGWETIEGGIGLQNVDNNTDQSVKISHQKIALIDGSSTSVELTTTSLSLVDSENHVDLDWDGLDICYLDSEMVAHEVKYGHDGISTRYDFGEEVNLAFPANSGTIALSSEVTNLANGAVASNTAAIENITKTDGLIDTALANAKAYVDEEDKFEIDMVTVNAHGGVAAGEDLNGLTTHEILKKILYPYVQPTVGNATASPNGGTYEKGVTKTITSVSISVTKKSEFITSVALYNGSTLIEDKTGDAVKNGGTITFSGLSVEVPTNGNQLTVKVTDAKGNVQEKKTTAMSFVYPYYIGTCAAGTTIDEALIESLTKKIEAKGNKSNSFTVSDGHMVFAYPKAHGVLKSILDPNNFETIGNYTRSEVSVTGLDGTAQAYYVYVSGATTVSGFTVNFKY